LSFPVAAFSGREKGRDPGIRTVANSNGSKSFRWLHCGRGH
jgi:hypothetical protein